MLEFIEKIRSSKMDLSARTPQPCDSHCPFNSKSNIVMLQENYSVSFRKHLKTFLQARTIRGINGN